MTVNPPAVADHDRMTVRRTIAIDAPAAKVWTAITEPEHVSRWFGRLTLDGRGAGAAGTIAWPGEPPNPIRVEAVDPPRSITYRWCEGADAHQGDLDDATATDFTFTITPTATGTELTVEESGFERTAEPATRLEEHRGGWDAELDKLVTALEGTHP